VPNGFVPKIVHSYAQTLNNVSGITNLSILRHSPRIDLNADVGEGAGHDVELMPFITSVNVACGAHAGDLQLMRTTVRLAHSHGVAVGAHPSFPDREGFGRRDLGLSPDEVEVFTAAQVGALAEVAAGEGVRLQHVKPHGALFNVAARDRPIADAVARATASVDPALILFGLPGSALVAAAVAAGLRSAREAFADRAYRSDGTLVPRTEPGAVIVDPDQVVARVVQAALTGTIVALDGTPVALEVDTICVHGDTPGAADLAARMHAALRDRGVAIMAVGASRA